MEREEVREMMKNPRETARELHREYGFSQKEFSKIVFITSTALLFVSIHVSTTLGDVQQDLQETEDSVQEATAIINSDSFRNALNTLQRIQSASISSQLETARSSFESARESFQDISQAEQDVGETKEMYQWISLISILGIVTSVALRLM